MTTSGAAPLEAIELSNNADWAEAHVVTGLPEEYAIADLTARMQVRGNEGASPRPVIDASTDLYSWLRFVEMDEDIVFAINVPATAMRSVPLGTYKRDILIYHGTSVIYAGRGDVTVIRGVTRV